MTANLLSRLQGLTAEQIRFLRELEPFAHPASRRELARPATRQEDKVRQSCRKMGLAEFVGGFLDGKTWPMGWRLTSAGMAILTALEARDGKD